MESSILSTAMVGIILALIIVAIVFYMIKKRKNGGGCGCGCSGCSMPCKGRKTLDKNE